MNQPQHADSRLTGQAGVSRRAAVRRIGGGTLAGILLGAAGNAGAQTGAETATTEATVRQAINAVNGVLAGGDAAALDRVFAPDYVNHTPHRPASGGESYPPDVNGLKTALADLRTAVPDALLIVEEIIATGDTAAARLTFRGTVSATAAASGESVPYPISVGGVAIVRVRDRLIVESWDYDEYAALFGGVPIGPAGAEEAPAADTAGERREIANASAVSVEGIGTLQLTQGAPESLTIEAEPKVLKRIASEVRDGTLYIQPDRSIRTREPIVYHLRLEDIYAITLSGAVQGEADQIAVDLLRIQLSGSSAFSLGDLTTDTLDLTANGNASAAIAGSVSTQTVDLSGSGRYLAGDLQSENASVTVSGAGQAEVRVATRLDVSISGAGSVVYHGSPEIRQSISGAGSLSQAG